MKQKEIQYLKAKYYYYIVGEPIMTDSAYDKLEQELKDLGSEIVELVDFPSEKQIKNFGIKLSDIVPKTYRDEVKYNHPTPMLSLEKIQVNDEENFPEKEITNFLNRLSHNLGYECTPKYDGNAIEHIYRDAKLDKCLTRGDDTVKGLDKKSKLEFTVPNEIPADMYEEGYTYQIRGEYVVDVDLWDKKYNNPEPGKISNPRNWIAGIIGRDELNLDCIKDIVFVAYDILLINEETNEVKYVDNSMDYLKKLGFNKTYEPKKLTIKTYQDFIKMYYEMKDYREKCPFLLDGIVLKYPEKHRYKLGTTSHHPKWAIAVKFPSLEVETYIKDIQWNLGKNRELTPVAILEPVELLGTIVTKASLSNLGNMFKIGGFPGAKVSLKKSGEIIPMITSVIDKSPDHDTYMNQLKQFSQS